MRWHPLWVLALLACADEPTKPDTPDEDSDPQVETDPVDTVDTVIDTVDTEVEPACPPLQITAEPAALNTRQRGIVRASGGEEPWVFSLGDTESGPILSETTGEYLSGDSPGLDVVRVTDACGQEAQTEILVVPHLVVQPTQVTMPPDTSVALSVEGGSGDVACRIGSTSSGGSLTGCQWTSGPNTGTDRIEVVDGVTDAVVEVSLAVREGAALELPEIVIALQSNDVDIPVAGGSGFHELTVVDGDAFLLDGMRVDATAPGEAVVSVEDRYVPGMGTTVRLVVAAPLSPTPVVDGESDSVLPVVTADLDNDGFTDAVVSQINGNSLQHRGGLVMVYRGTATGLDPDPVQVFEGTGRVGALGRSLEVGDLSGDGIPDLVIGEEGLDGSTGRITVHTGVGDGTFATPPWIDKPGEFNGDRLGTGVALCDIDADGTLDLVASARTGDDRSVSPTITNVGVVSAWPVSTQGLAPTSAWSALGVELLDGAFVVAAGDQLGRNVRVGDVDGDTRCDVAVSVLGSDSIMVYASGDALPGEHLPTLPSRVYQAEEGHEDFDFALEVADLDGDGLDDVIAGGWRTDGTEGANRSGGAYIFFAADDDGRPATEPMLRSEASVSIVGSESNEEVGVSLGVVDLDGDGLLELFVGGVDTRDPSDDGIDDTGGLQWFSGALLAGSDPGTVLTGLDAMGALYGQQEDGAFGLGAGYLPQVDGWVVTEGRSNHLGPRVGDVYLATADGLTSLMWPNQEGGAMVGVDDAMTLFDDGSDAPVVLVSSSQDGIAPDLLDAGQVTQFSDGISFPWYDLPDESGPTLPDLRSSVEVGFRIGQVGDLDQDGIIDVAVVVRSQRDRPDLYEEEVDDAEACSSRANNTGMVAVYRGGHPPGAPDYLAFGAIDGGRIERVVGGDMNGDGFGDLIYTSTSVDPESLTIAYGRAPGDTSVILCDRWTLTPRPEGESFGDDLLALGDLDDDGCDDIAVSAPNADPNGGTNQGAVWILFGWGETCASDTPRHTGLAGPLDSSRMGTSMAVGDLDSDGDLELLLGAPDGGLGRVYVYPLEEAIPQATTVEGTFLEPSELVTEVLAEGLETNGDFGRAVTVVASAGAPWVVVGEPYHDLPGGAVEDVGLVHLLRHDGSDVRVAGLVGLDASHDPRATEGAELGHGLVGVGGTLLLGAPYSSSVFSDNGAVYRVELD